MAKFHIRLFGSSVIEPFDLEHTVFAEPQALSRVDLYVQRTLKLYYPVYYTAAAWTDKDGAPGELIAEWKAEVSVVQTAQYNDGRRVT